MKVGGRDFDLTKAQVEALMRDEIPELIQKHIVEVGPSAFPPKQVLGHVTGWPRTSYTTMEAQRVLARLGFVCREARAESSTESRVAPQERHADAVARTPADHDARIAALEAALITANAAIAGLDGRLRHFESRA